MHPVRLKVMQWAIVYFSAMAGFIVTSNNKYLFGSSVLQSLHSSKVLKNRKQVVNYSSGLHVGHNQ